MPTSSPPAGTSTRLRPARPRRRRRAASTTATTTMRWSRGSGANKVFPRSGPLGAARDRALADFHGVPFRGGNQEEPRNHGRAPCAAGPASPGWCPSPSRSSSRWAVSGAQPASVRKRRSAVVGGDRPQHRALEPVGLHGVDRRLEQPGAVALPALVGVDGELHQLARRRPGRSRGRSAGEVIAKPTTRLRSRATRTRLRASCGRVSTPRQISAARAGSIGQRLGRQQVGVQHRPGAGLERGDGLGVVGPGDPDRDVGGGAAAWRHPVRPSLVLQTTRPRCGNL